jgi:hypothetical protein
MKRTSFFIILATAIFSIALVPTVAMTYSYNLLSFFETGAGFLILLIVATFLWANYRQTNYSRNFARLEIASSVGIVLGVLWLIEISINNFIAPPLPARDIIDNLFWGSIALSILVYAIISAYQANSVVQGIKVATWSGFVSGLLACCSALAIIVFAMPFITQDPLNIAEWAASQASSQAPTMEAYFAFETFAGAFLHLLVLGFCMGGLLGVFGGIVGKSAGRANLRWLGK